VTDSDYPEHLLAREAAPRYAGEGPFALWHFSEDPSLGRFLPHVPVTNPQARHAGARIELRVTPSIWPFWRQVTASTVAFSGSRLHNAAPHPDRPRGYGTTGR
jgi:hypothetical protein